MSLKIRNSLAGLPLIHRNSAIFLYAIFCAIFMSPARREVHEFLASNVDLKASVKKIHFLLVGDKAYPIS